MPENNSPTVKLHTVEVVVEGKRLAIMSVHQHRLKFGDYFIAFGTVGLKKKKSFLTVRNA